MELTIVTKKRAVQKPPFYANNRLKRNQFLRSNRFPQVIEILLLVQIKKRHQLRKLFDLTFIYFVLMFCRV